MTQPTVKVLQIDQPELTAFVLALIGSPTTAGASNLTELSDVTIGSPRLSGEQLVFNGSTWTNTPTTDIFTIGDGLDSTAFAGSPITIQVDSTVARRNATNTFQQTNTYTAAVGGISSGALFQSSAPGFILDDTGGAADESIWRVYSSGGQLIFDTRNDANSVSVNWLTVNRTGTTVDSIDFTGTAMTLNGLSVHVGSPQPSGGGSGTVTSVGTNTGLSGTVTTSGNLSLDLPSLAVGGTLVTGDWLIADNGGVQNKQLISAIPLSIFSNDSGWTSNAGTVTSVTGGVGVASTGGTTPSISLTVDELAEKTGAVVGTDRLVGTTATTNWAETISNIPLSIFSDDLGHVENATHTGDVAGATVLTIQPDAVTMDMIVDVATDTFLGRVTAATGTVEVLTNAQAKTALDLTGTNSGDNAGVTSVTGGTGVASTGGTTPSISLTVDELAEKSGALVGTDRFVGTTGATNWAETISGIPLSIFNNDLGGGGDFVEAGSPETTINAKPLFLSDTFRLYDSGQSDYMNFNWSGSDFTTTVEGAAAWKIKPSDTQPLWVARRLGSPIFDDVSTSTTNPTMRIGVGSPTTTNAEATLAIIDNFGPGLVIRNTFGGDEVSINVGTNNEFISKTSNFTTWTVEDDNGTQTIIMSVLNSDPIIQFQSAAIGDVKIDTRTINNQASTDTGWTYSTTNNIFFIEPSASNINFGGMSSGRNNGQWLTIINAAAGPGSPAIERTITFEHEEGTATATHRFLLPGAGDIILRPHDSIQIVYDGTVSRWRCMSTTGVQVSGSPLAP